MPLFKRETVSWVVLTIEMVAIMLSVVLGFALNEWRTGRAEARAVTTAQESIARELEVNLAQTMQQRERFQAIDDSLAALQEQQGPDAPLDPFFGSPGFLFNQGAYEAARASGALSHMDFETLEMITTAYFVQEYRTEIGQLFIEQQLSDGPYLQTVGDYRGWMQAMLAPELPAQQEATLRVLKGEALDNVASEVNAKYFGQEE
jgi:hypothetical protein